MVARSPFTDGSAHHCERTLASASDMFLESMPNIWSATWSISRRLSSTAASATCRSSSCARRLNSCDASCLAASPDGVCALKSGIGVLEMSPIWSLALPCWVVCPYAHLATRPSVELNHIRMDLRTSCSWCFRVVQVEPPIAGSGNHAAASG